MQITAAVVGAPSAPFVIDALELSDPRPNVVLVRIVASGMRTCTAACRLAGSAEVSSENRAP